MTFDSRRTLLQTRYGIPITVVYPILAGVAATIWRKPALYVVFAALAVFAVIDTMRVMSYKKRLHQRSRSEEADDPVSETPKDPTNACT